MKACLRCGKEKPTSEFGKHRARKDGLQAYCKNCRAQYYQSNKERIAEKNARYRREHKEESARYRREHKKEKAAYNARYRRDHKEKEAAYQAKYRQAHKEKGAAYGARYEKQRRATDIQFRLTCNLRTRLWNALKNNFKAGSAVQDLGCSIAEFRLYIENQFEPGMTWENYGEWELDHVIALANFDLTNHMELLEACNWLNYQPLWKLDNIKKGAK